MAAWLAPLLAAFVFFVLLRYVLPVPKVEVEGEKPVCFSRSKVFGSERFYFGTKGVFVCRGRVLTARYGFDEIVKLGRGGLKVNNADVWQMECVSKDGRRVFYSFCPDSGWRRSGFERFYGHLRRVNPDAVRDR